MNDIIGVFVAAILLIVLSLLIYFPLHNPDRRVYPENFDELIKRDDSLMEKYIYYYDKALHEKNSYKFNLYMDSLNNVCKKSEKVHYLIYNVN